MITNTFLGWVLLHIITYITDPELYKEMGAIIEAFLVFVSSSRYVRWMVVEVEAVHYLCSLTFSNV